MLAHGDARARLILAVVLNVKCDSHDFFRRLLWSTRADAALAVTMSEARYFRGQTVLIQCPNDAVDELQLRGVSRLHEMHYRTGDGSDVFLC